VLAWQINPVRTAGPPARWLSVSRRAGGCWRGTARVIRSGGCSWPPASPTRRRHPESRWLVWAIAAESLLFELMFAVPGTQTFGSRTLTPYLVLPEYHRLGAVGAATNIAWAAIFALVLASLVVRYPRSAWDAGVGLTSMRERAAELGGSCEAGPGPGGGGRVTASLPLGEIAAELAVS
jgi:hypothetical protein